MASSPYLPPEIWITVLEYLPPSFFQEDIGRLTLSKNFYSLAFPVFFSQLECTPRVLSRLVNRKSKAVGRARDLLQKRAHGITIALHGMGEDWATLYNTPSNLIRFCQYLERFSSLRTLRFVASWPNRQWKGDPFRANYLPLRSIKPFLENLTHITNLDLDLCGTSVTKENGECEHLCPFIRPLLSRLHTIQLRAQSLCQAALRPLEGQAVTLQRITVNLNLGDVSEDNTKLNATRRCHTLDLVKWASWSCPALVLCRQLRALAARMPDRSQAQLIHISETGEVHRWDALTESCEVDGRKKSLPFPRFRGDEVVRCYTMDDSFGWGWNPDLPHQ